MLKCLIAAAALASVSAAHAGVATVEATFLGKGTYATAEGCKMVRALAAGAERGINTVPDTLTSSGIEGWEGGCAFTSISEIEKGKKWKTEMQCVDGPEENTATEIFERLSDRRYKASDIGADATTIYERCDADKEK